PFRALCTALAATGGTGNIAGVAGAIALGGAGAVFWMWVSAFLGMAVKTAEITLSVHYREKNKKGEFAGGPMYFIRNGLGERYNLPAVCYAVMGVVAVFGIGNAVQVNTLLNSVSFTLSDFCGKQDLQNNPLFKLFIGAAVAVFAATVLVGGAEKVGRVTGIMVPFMAVSYLAVSAGAIILNAEKLPAVFAMIFTGAFKPAAVTGGAVGSIFLTLKTGFSRGVFSNEAGLGTAGIAHSASNIENPAEQGLFGIFEVFADTIVICTLTSLVILISGVPINYGKAAGAELALFAFKSVYGKWASVLLCMALCSFALSTVIGWGFYGLRCFEFLFGFEFNKCFFLLYSAAAVLGAVTEMKTVWKVSETVNGLMIIPNLCGVILLLPVAVGLIKKYDKNS
ncbi:MAG: amino acid carrier protein, partial [Clostridiales bacterium]|nr:amino acid carrier protein [Candidatus Equinaster intestinalis]